MLAITIQAIGQTGVPDATPVTQDFNAMSTGTALPANWRMQHSATPTWGGGTTTLGQAANSGSPNTGATYNWGNTAGTDRSVGAMTSGTFSSPNNLMGYYKNTSASNITNLSISYTGKRYRINTAVASVQFFYSLDGSNWTPITSGDIAPASFPTGADAYNFTPGLVVTVPSFNISGLSIIPNGNFYLRWNINTTGSNSQGIGIDDISVTATLGPASPLLSATTLTAFGSQCINGTYGPNTFTVTGSTLTNADVTVGALSGYTYSTTAGGTYTSSLSLAQPGGAYSQTIYVKFNPVAETAYSGNISVGGGGASSTNVAASGSGVNTAPMVTTGAASSITSASATVAGTLSTASSCGTVTAYGIEYSTTSGFTGGTGTAVPSTNLSGTSFSSTLTGLNPCTVYYTHAYATRASGTTYGSQGTFTTAALAAPAATAATGIGANGFTANWGAVASATGYFLDVSTSPTFGSPGGQLVAWNFTNATTTATGGIAANLSKTISTNADGTLTYTSTNNQLYLDGWDSGNNSKYWQISLVTTGYSNLTLSSIQGSSGTGPKNFKVQYRIGTGGAWTDVPSGTVTVANDVTTGKLTNLPLPAACDNQPDVYLRWIMTSNTSVGNSTVASGGTSRISAISVDATSQPSFVPGYNNLSVAGTTQSVSGLTPGTTYYYRVRAQATGCTSANSNVITVATAGATYYSRSSGNVGDAIWATTPTGTAGAATFNATASMVVQAGHTVGATASTDVKKLTVESGATLALSSGTTFTVNGDEAIFDGALTAPDNSTLALAGSGASILASDGGPLNLWNLTVNTPLGTLTDATIAIRGTLQLDAGELDASLAHITLRSQAGGTGRLGPVGATASYTGDITMERYIPAGHTNWRMLGSPVGGQTVANWQDDFFTAGYPGSQYPNFYNPVNSNILWPSIRWYDETVVTNDANAGVVGVSSNLQSLAKGQGFLAWCGDNFSTTNAFTVNVTGAPYIAHTPITLPMSFTSSGTVAADGWNLVSNPLPSPIDFTKLVRGADVGNSYWIFDPVTGNNLAWSNGVGQGGLNGKIQSSQGFWLKAGGSATTTTVDESAKVNQPMGGTFGGDQAPALPLLNLTLASGINSFSDMATIAFAQGTPAYDAIDALKMTFRTPGAPQLGIRSSDNQLLAVDFFGSYSEAVSIPLQVDVDVTGTYTITAGISGINTLSCLSLTDLQTGAVTPLSDGASYSFSINADDDASLPRFVLHGSKPLPLVVDQAQCHGGQGAGTVIVPDGAPVDVTWADAFGNTLLTMPGIAGGIAEYEAPAGNYQVRITPGGACGTLAADFTITQPEAIGADVLQTATTCPNSADGSIMVAGVTGGTAPYSFLWSNGGTTNSITGAAGTYTGTITDAAGCVDHVLAAIPAGEGVVAQFSVQGVAVAGTPVEFLNHTELGTDYAWDFGDGSSSGEMAPSHTYALPGVYTVTLSATGNSCYSTFSLDLTVEAATAVAAATAAPLAVWATPDNIVVEHSFGNAPVNVDVYDATGRLAMSQSRLVKPGRITLGDRSLNSGVWFVRITSGDVQRTFRVPLVR